MNLLDSVKAARRVSTPLVAITTPDPAATIHLLREGLGNGQGGKAPLLQWDAINAVVALNGLGEVALLRLVGVDPETYNRDNPEQVRTFRDAVVQATGNLTEALMAAVRLPGDDDDAGVQGAVLFIHNAHLFLGPDVPGNQGLRQAVWNLRDRFKADRRTLILLAPELTLPVELAQDVIVLEEPLPADYQLQEIVKEQCRSAGLPEPVAGVLLQATDALRGIATFPAEQITAMSLRKSGVDLDSLRERKRREVEKTRGLGVDRESVRLADVGGKEQIKKLLRGVFTGNARPGVVVRLDEIEKSMAGSGSSGGDTTGVAQDQSGVVLKEMEDNGYTGLILVSPPGCGKTLLSKALGGEFDVMSISLDLGGAKEKWVGSSEEHIRQAFRVIKALAGPGGAFLIATCNGLDSVSPELRRRFRLGIWYDDLPTKEERDQIWGIQLASYKLAESERPDDSGWTGADIRNCCDVTWRLGCSLREASQYLVPVSQSDPQSIVKLRNAAQGRFLSTAYPGPYRGPDEVAQTGKLGGRRVRVEG